MRCLMLLLCCTPLASAVDSIVADKLAKKIDAPFTALNGQSLAFKDLAGPKGLVVAFMSFDCPVSNDTAVQLTQLSERFGKEFGFVAVCPSDDAADALKKQAADFKIPFTVCRDADLRTADAFKATTTPEAFVLDANSVLRYRGRVDNAYSARLKKNIKTTDFDLRSALEDMTANKEVRTPVTKPIGCPIASKEPKKNPTTQVTYYKDVLPILQNHCQSCHRPGEVGPFSLMTYKQAVNWSEDIKEYTASKKMPPWKPVEGMAFKNERKLTDAELRTIAAWTDGGTPEGNPADAPKPLTFTQGWTKGEPDLVLTVKDEFTLDASGKDTFRCFVLPTNLTEDKYVIGFEVRPGNPRVVHHTLNFWDVSGRGREMEKETAAKAKPTDLDRGPGYSASMGVGFIAGAGKMGGMGGWAPGQMPTSLPDGAGYFLPKGADLIIQTHYHRNGKVEKDKLSIGLYFAKKPTKQKYQSLVINGFGFLNSIPAGNDKYIAKGSGFVNADCTIHSVMPHMHLLGKTVKVTMTTPEGVTKTLVSIDDWDYNWQETYWLKEKLQVKAGTRFDIEAVYDNSAGNPNNPTSPPKTVFAGEQTTNEMLFGFLGATSETGERLFAKPNYKK